MVVLTIHSIATHLIALYIGAALCQLVHVIRKTDGEETFFWLLMIGVALVVTIVPTAILGGL